MAFSSGSHNGPMAEINVTPLVDVMLVLLIIFIVTAPILTYPISVDLPQQTTTPPPMTQDPPPPIKLKIDAANQVFWNGELTDLRQLPQRLTQIVERDPTNQPQLQIDADAQSEYEIMAKVLAAAKTAEIKNIGFIQKDS